MGYMKRKPPRRFTLGQARPSIFDWAVMVARMNESCTLNHSKQGRHGDNGWECPRCNDLYAQALIYSDITGRVPSLVVLERLLGALEGTGEKAA